MIEFTCRSPIELYIPRKTKPAKLIRLNMNEFVNYHRFTLNTAKSLYNTMMTEPLKEMVRLVEIESIEYYYFKRINRKIDRANVLTIVDKFFCDALVYHGKIPDDNDSIIKSTKYYTGGIEPLDPHVMIKIKGQPVLI